MVAVGNGATVKLKGGYRSMLKRLIYTDIVARGKSEATAKEWAAVAAEFEQVCGGKESYTRADVTAFLFHLRERGLLQSTIDKDLKAIKLLAQIQGWEFPKLSMRRVRPDEVSRPILDNGFIRRLIMAGKNCLTGIELCYLALAITYGLRRVEMTRLQPSDLTLDTITINTAKEGPKTTHLVPPEIAPYLACFQPYKADSLTHMFHGILIKTGLKCGRGFGWHSVRRALATELLLSNASALNVIRFMRWSDNSARGEFNILAIYAKKDQARIDREIFKIHPFLSWW